MIYTPALSRYRGGLLKNGLAGCDDLQRILQDDGYIDNNSLHKNYDKVNRNFVDIATSNQTLKLLRAFPYLVTMLSSLAMSHLPNPAIEIAATFAKPHRRGVRQSPKGDFASVGAVSNEVAASTAGKSKCDIAKLVSSQYFGGRR